MSVQAEALYRQFKAKKEVLQGKTKEQVTSKYGTAAKAPDEEVLALAQSEAYTEYNAEVHCLLMQCSLKSLSLFFSLLDCSCLWQAAMSTSL